MEYYQTIQYIAQENFPYLDKILEFEKYKKVINCNNDYLISLPQDEYICLEELIELTKSQYLRIYIGQVIMIANRILQYLKQLFVQKITHGNLCSNNIYIRLDDQKFNIIPIRVEIAQIHFVNYKFLNQKQFQLNRVKDIQDARNTIVSWISQYKKISQIKDLIDNLNQTNSLGLIIDLLENFKKKYIYIETQELINDELIFDEDKRINCLNSILEFYQDFYQQQELHIETWLDNRFNIAQDHPFYIQLKEIYKLILTQNQRNIFTIFQIQSIGILNESDQDTKLDDLIEQIKEIHFQHHQQLNEQQMQQIGNQIDQLAQRQISFQLKIQEKWNTQLKILQNEQIACAYKILLAYELSKFNCNEMKVFQKIQQIIQICLEKEIDQYLEFQLKKKILKLMNDLK
ncbi:unnamed protein product [Paramecium octaurelia]|uniref:Uncharacterized protein n=1 Tax=Paramecium octaurelia TaxID=43137 RepID=A0A8S1SVA9_PAROT|nr:unnamed protein product [Paramecium octaurelia]